MTGTRPITPGAVSLLALPHASVERLLALTGHTANVLQVP